MTDIEATYLEACRRLIEAKLAWGPVEGWSTSDFDELSDLIAADTGKTVGASTLKRVWGRVKYDSSPSQHTLNILAGYVGANSWRAFKAQVDSESGRTGSPPPLAPLQVAPITGADQPPRSRPEGSGLALVRIWGSVLMLIVIVTVIISVLDGGNPVLADSTLANVQFASRPVATGLPNSVVFTYELAGVEADSFFIQQSWDRRLRDRILKSDREFTSIYFYPGHFWAKLVANDTVLREHALIVPSGGWLGLIEQPGPAPIYVPLEEPSGSSGLTVASSWIADSDIPLLKAEAEFSLFHVGEFPGFSDRAFELNSDVRIELERGRGACKEVRIVLIGQHGRIDIPFSITGCSSELAIVASERAILGRTHDLSSLGVDLSTWHRIGITGENGRVSVSIDGEPVYELSYDETIGNVVGFRYRFKGRGAVRNVLLSSASVTIFEDL